MRRVIILAALASIFGGVAGGAGVYFMLARSVAGPSKIRPEARAQIESQLEAGDYEGSAAEERMRKIEHRIALLSHALAQREGRESGQLGDEGDSGRVVATDVADPVFEAAVLDIMDREESRKTEERDTWRSELRVERSRRFATELQKPLGLSADQRDRVAEVVQAYFQEFQDLRDSPDRPVTRRQWAERTENLQKTLEEGLKATLTPSQYSAYEALSDEDKIGFGWGRGRARDDRSERR